MITAVNTAIMTLYNGGTGASLRAANTGGLHWEEAPQGATEPYTVLSIASSSIDDSMGGKTDRIERMDYQFSIFTRNVQGTQTNPGDQLATIVGLLIDWFDEATLSISGFTHLRNERNGIGNVPVIDDIWQSTILYTIWFCWR